MAKLKKHSIQKIVCPTCKGNGFLKIIFDTNDTNIFQCWDCDSEGEFYEDIGVGSLIGDTNGGDSTLH